MQAMMKHIGPDDPEEITKRTYKESGPDTEKIPFAISLRRETARCAVGHDKLPVHLESVAQRHPQPARGEVVGQSTSVRNSSLRLRDLQNCYECGPSAKIGWRSGQLSPKACQQLGSLCISRELLGRTHSACLATFWTCRVP